MQKDIKKPCVVVVGAGAAGVWAALSAREEGADVILIEGKKALQKVRASGDGRANLTNEMASKKAYGKASWFVEEAFRRYGGTYLKERWESFGVPLYCDGRKRFYPASLEAKGVAHLLFLLLQEKGVTYLEGVPVVKVQPDYVELEDGRKVYGDAIVLALGSPASPHLGGNESVQLLGEPMTPFSPGLSPLCVDLKSFRHAIGTRLSYGVRLFVDDALLEKAEGDVLFTKEGLSGNAIFDVSGTAEAMFRAGKKVSLEVPLSIANVDIDARLQSLGHRKTKDFFLGWLSSGIAKALLQEVGLDPEKPALHQEKKKWHKLAGKARCKTFYIEKSAGFRKAQVALGGLALEAVDPMSLSLWSRPSLFVAGEMLDVTGPCGGYNLTWAFISGEMAGREAFLYAKNLRSK